MLRARVEEFISQHDSSIDVRVMPRSILYDTYWKIMRERNHTIEEKQQCVSLDTGPQTSSELVAPVITGYRQQPPPLTHDKMNLNELLIRIDQEFGSVSLETKTTVSDIKIGLSLASNSKNKLENKSVEYRNQVMKILHKLYDIIRQYYEKIQKTPSLYDTRQAIRYELLLHLLDHIQ